MTDATARSARIGIAGDVMLGRLVNERMKREGWSYPWGDMRTVLASRDAFLVNLECAVPTWRVASLPARCRLAAGSPPARRRLAAPTPAPEATRRPRCAG